MIFLLAACTRSAPGCGCSCCCVHWAGAGVGTWAGFWAAWRRTDEDDNIPPAARLCISHGIAWGFVISVLLLFASIIIVDNVWLLVAMLPSVVLLPVGLSTMVGGAIGRAMLVGDSTVTADQRRSVMRSAWRLSWLPIAVATLLSGLGYLVMLSPFFVFG